VPFGGYAKEGIIVNDQREEQSEARTSPEDRAREITVRADYATTFPTYYANFAFVTHTSYDLSIDFCFLAPPHRVNESQGILSVPVVTRMTIPSGLVEGLINALNSQLTAQRQEHEEGRIVIAGPHSEGSSDG
jgi:hypothetical protein